MTDPDRACYNAALETGIELAAATLRSWAGNKMGSSTCRMLRAAADDLVSHKSNITAAHKADVPTATAAAA